MLTMGITQLGGNITYANGQAGRASPAPHPDSPYQERLVWAATWLIIYTEYQVVKHMCGNKG